MHCRSLHLGAGIWHSDEDISWEGWILFHSLGFGYCLLCVQSSFLPTHSVWEKRWWLKFLSTFHSCGRSRLSSEFLTLDWPIPSCCGNLWSELAGRRSLCVLFKISLKCWREGGRRIQLTSQIRGWSPSLQWHTLVLIPIFYCDNEATGKERAVSNCQRLFLWITGLCKIGQST